MLKQIHKDLVEEVKSEGIAKSHIRDILPQEDLDKFNNIIDFYNGFLSVPHIIDRCNRIAQGNPIRDRDKWYEITQYQYLGRGLTLNDGDIINFFLSETLIDMAAHYHNESPKLRNVLSWIHPQNLHQREFASQTWHRDPEDFNIFKVFINFNDITKSNGALQYAKQTQFGGEHQFITYNIDGSGHKHKPPGWPLSYPIPPENIVYAEGEVGTIFFVNTHGLHKGGLVKEGIRCLGQGCYLHPKSHGIIDGSLPTFNYNPDINFVDYNSDEYLKLTQKQQNIIN